MLQASYSDDLAKAAENIVFFYVPFALLFLLLCEVRLTRRLVLACLGVAVGLAVVFAGVGFVEYYRKALFLNPKVVAANQFDNYFRVNSVFFDPSIYGRFLALVMIAVDDRECCGARAGATCCVGAALIAWLLARAGDELLAVVDRRAAARAGGARRLSLGRARDASTVAAALVAIAARRAARRAAEPALRPERLGRLGEQRDERSHEPDLGRPGPVRARPLQGYGSGSFETRVQAPPQGEHRERDLGLAHDPDHGRRRAGR